MKKTSVILLIIIISSLEVLSESSYVSQIPNGSKFSCATCHQGSNYKSFNSFGSKIKSSYMSGGKVKWNASLASLDSDGDGKTNGQELQDVNGSWTIGTANPGISSLVTNPGDASSYSSVEEIFKNEKFIESIEIYPNPLNYQSVIKIQINYPDYLKFDIFDIFGNIVSSLPTTQYNSGLNTIPLSNFDGINGTYFIKISNEKYYYCKMLVK